MKANPNKSSLVFAVRGYYADTWLRQHLVRQAGKQYVQLGAPTEPLLIPLVREFVYLGVVISCGDFEGASARYRIQAAQARRAQLHKILHSSRHLSLFHRVRMYMTCVRSSLLYGLLAVGVTPQAATMLRRVEMRHLRAIAKAPVHLTLESNSALLARLQVEDPVHAVEARLAKLVQGGPRRPGFIEHSVHLHHASTLHDLRACCDGRRPRQSRAAQLVPLLCDSRITPRECLVRSVVSTLLMK